MELNFTISEMIYSETAIKYNINNMPDVKSLDNLLNLIFYVLQPLRDKLGKPITITNGFRSRILWEKLNKLGYNPSKTSEHLFGCAVDIAQYLECHSAIFFILLEKLTCRLISLYGSKIVIIFT